jgi:hypothetical protein
VSSPEPSVEAIEGEPLRYWVRSDSARSLPRLVDLTENGGHGMCFCPDFLCRREPLLKKGAPKFSPQAQCKHIRLARTHFLNTALEAISQQIVRP